MNIAIRAMRTGDIAPAIRLWSATPGTSTGDSVAVVRRILRRNPDGSFVAVERGRLVGAVLGTHDGRRGTLWHLAVAADRRRRGLGQALTGRVLAWLKRERISKANILVLANNRRAIRFWRRIGWARIPVVTMSRRLRL